jgi:hypothetical protein
MQAEDTSLNPGVLNPSVERVRAEDPSTILNAQQPAQTAQAPASSESYTDFLKRDFDELFNSLEKLIPRQQKFLRSRWLDQVLYMEKKASQCRDRYYRLRLTTIVGGVITPILVSLNTGAVNDLTKSLLSATTIVLGGLVAASAAIEEFFHYGERWNHYRRSAESLKSLGWQFSQLCGPYRRFKTHAEAFPVFADQIEDIIRQDVEQFSVQQQANQQDDQKQQTAEDEF